MLPVYAQQEDSVAITLDLKDVVIVSESYRKAMERASALPIEVAGEQFLMQHLGGNLAQTLAHLPGIHSMDIGSGFAKPMIRGMGFNRISVTENGIKQEGQQWGADHGLEIDAFGAERILVRKGPASLLYGSDAMGGVIEISQLPPPPDNRVFGEVITLGKSGNATLGGSLMTGFRYEAFHAKLRYSEQHFADYRIPADTIVYLTQHMPVHGRRLKNTAGFERDASLHAGYRLGAYGATYVLSNAFQQTGFFPGAHGIPDAARLTDDGNRRNVDLPFSRVNHLKASSRQQYAFPSGTIAWDAGFQQNDREEWSLFHTHYAGQSPPEKEADRELAFTLRTFSSSARLRLFPSGQWEHTFGWDMHLQHNRIGGYAFLLPAYRRFSSGALWLASYTPVPGLDLSGGLRYDFGRIRCEAYSDPYLESYLLGRGYTAGQIEAYRWRSYPADRSFGDISASAGLIWTPNGTHRFKANIGRSFRLPGANELASNGVHHGAFRHEQGDPSLGSEKGWQCDVSAAYQGPGLSLSLSPFVAWFDNYIYLKPTGEWSALPHAGQIYRYTGAEAVFAGAEAALSADFPQGFTYEFTAEYVHTYNMDEHIPLSFSPPPAMNNTLSWRKKDLRVYAGLQSIAAQHRTARNEDPTPGAHLLHGGASFPVVLCGTRAEVHLSVHNLLDTAFYNHLSFYRKVEIPEPGRSFRFVIKIPFKNNLK
ncbi:MAG: TonB-dependent receptor [Tannerellaceae bacterium]|jgi:iron complex outermembrane receptor protein|nr:TonB-dependent receptor [Tannerellaceae bacterium]